LASKLLLDPSKVCGTCTHIRPCLGLIDTLEFRAKLKRAVQLLEAEKDTMENISIDNNLFEVLAQLNWMQKRKLYCKKEKSWTHLFDTACYAWQPKIHSLYRTHTASMQQRSSFQSWYDKSDKYDKYYQ